MTNRWHIITGEYPPQPGGVADYTKVIAQGLAAAGDAVTIWAPECAGADPDDPVIPVYSSRSARGSSVPLAEREEYTGITVRRLPGHFGPRALVELDKALGKRSTGRILLQYTPHAFGWKAMNFPLILWIWRRARPLDVMFHEVAYPFEPGQPFKHKVLAASNRVMASLLLRAAERVFVTIPGWVPLLRRLAARIPEPCWIPIPSPIPLIADAEMVTRLRTTWESSPPLRGGIQSSPPLRGGIQSSPPLRGGTGSEEPPRSGGLHFVGHFGTYGDSITRFVGPMLEKLFAAHASVAVVLLGRGGDRYAASLSKTHPEWANRLIAPGGLDREAAATHLAACDVLVQPYIDGISSRRSSAIAGLALGRPTVTTEGHLTEPAWRTSGAVEIVPGDQLADAVLQLLADPQRRAELGQRAAEYYRKHFAVEHTIQALRRLPAAS